MFAKNKITFSVTEEFRKIRVFDQPSRLYPVFINLLEQQHLLGRIKFKR